MKPQQIADIYFAAMRSGDLPALLALFAENGVICWPDGTALEGRKAIEAGYQMLFARSPANPSPGALLIARDDYFAAQVTTRLGDGRTTRTINVFCLDAQGLIARLDSYRQG